MGKSDLEESSAAQCQHGQKLERVRELWEPVDLLQRRAFGS
jgi:hypothetical protein